MVRVAFKLDSTRHVFAVDKTAVEHGSSLARKNLRRLAHREAAGSFGKLVVIKRNGEEGKNAFKIRKNSTIGR